MRAKRVLEAMGLIERELRRIARRDGNWIGQKVDHVHFVDIWDLNERFWLEDPQAEATV
jgi:hypothetical protein